MDFLSFRFYSSVTFIIVTREQNCIVLLLDVMKRPFPFQWVSDVSAIDILYINSSFSSMYVMPVCHSPRTLQMAKLTGTLSVQFIFALKSITPRDTIGECILPSDFLTLSEAIRFSWEMEGFG